MPAVSTSWLVGYATLAQQEWDGGTGPANVTLPAGTYALRHGTAALSLIDQVAAVWTLEWGAAVTVTVRRNRLIRITIASGGAAIDWGAATVLRDLLGFTGNRASNTTHDADYISPLLFSPGYPFTPTTISGVSGYTVSHQSRYKADDGTQLYVVHYGDETWQELRVPHVVPSRLRTTGTTAAQGGTFHQFYEQCAKYGRRFLHYETITEDSSSTTAVTWTTALGPYAMREINGDWYRRNVPNAEVSSPLELPLLVLAEVT